MTQFFKSSTLKKIAEGIEFFFALCAGTHCAGAHFSGTHCTHLLGGRRTQAARAAGECEMEEEDAVAFLGKTFIFLEEI